MSRRTELAAVLKLKGLHEREINALIDAHAAEVRAETIQIGRESARAAAVAKLNSIYAGQIPDRVARDIADAVLDALTNGGA
ncbi:hypothetical protein [Streptomyces achromogenes]|uniref:hypothetical protein n=1 Tax=Streptomyces achromogenes TaxID=67255 RepID=UPI0034475718